MRRFVFIRFETRVLLVLVLVDIIRTPLGLFRRCEILDSCLAGDLVFLRCCSSFFCACTRRVIDSNKKKSASINTNDTTVKNMVRLVSQAGVSVANGLIMNCLAIRSRIMSNTSELNRIDRMDLIRKYRHPGLM